METLELLEPQITVPETTDSTDFLPLKGTDYLELYVSNARQAAHYFQTAFGFQPLAYAGLETGLKDRESYVVVQDKIRLILTSPLHSNTEIGRHIDQHGDGVQVVALWVDDATSAFDETTNRGAKPFMKPTREDDKHGYVVRSGIHTYGDTVHVFVERGHYDGVFLPGFKAWTPHYQPPATGLKYVDHMVGNVGWNEMNTWTKFYGEVMGFSQLVSFDDKDFITGHLLTSRFGHFDLLVHRY